MVGYVVSHDEPIKLQFGMTLTFDCEDHGYILFLMVYFDDAHKNSMP